jgi:stage IV sporulation protein FB
MFGASETAYDLRFRFLDVPVRIHPMFWLVSAVLGWHEKDVPMTGLWVLCVLVSILVHEYGHALMGKFYYGSPSIVLWGLGGLCYTQSERQTPLQRLAVILAGPGAGFALAFMVMVVTWIMTGISPVLQTATIVGRFIGEPMPAEVGIKLAHALPRSETATHVFFSAYYFLIWINVVWGLINLLPLWPLDGGQATQILLTFVDRQRGRRWGHIVSLLVAGGLAVVSFTFTKSVFQLMFFGYFAFVNYQVLEAMHHAHGMGLYQEEDWWRN